ncbi:lantibiotic dehydratase [Nocardiopsis dassonvillei]|uniref:lantibiotic dehydratase n=1 Tax=Nocardiopsis dassonvillei TaxID=2014 RepID=UPI0036731E34
MSGQKWLSALWESPQVRNALSASSPGLCARVEAIVSRECVDGRRVRKAVLSMAAYLARWQRPTPFGLFAGTAPVTVGPAPAVNWGEDHLLFLRADSEWLCEVIARLHRCPALVERLRVVANNTAQIRGNRVVVAGQSADARARLAAPVEVSVRRTPPVATALQAARFPVPYRQVREELSRCFANAPREKITALLQDLLAQHVLLSSLWAPITHPDALGYLCDQLTELDAGDIDEIAGLAEELHAIHADLTHPTAHTTWPQRAPLLERMRVLSDAAPVPVIVDTALDCHLELPTGVMGPLEQAADVLTRVSAHPFGRPEWRDYHHRFRSRYGPGAVVPVLDLVADSGLGWPAGYLGSDRRRPPQLLTDRDTTLLDLVQRATALGEEEIVLTEEVITRLGPAEGEPTAAAPRVEIAVQLHASTMQDLARGAFTAVVTGAPRPGSSMLGRFTHLLPDDARQTLAASYRSPDPEVVVAQLSFPARKRRNDNIVRTPQLLPLVVPLAEHQPDSDAVIAVTDLGVSADATSLRLRQLSTGQHVELRVAHALEAGAHTPPLARFLSEVATARCAAYGAFDFGAAARLPYLPRVRYANTIVSPARWLLGSDDLQDTHAPNEEWEKGLERWRKRWRVPEQVVLVEHDRRLPLDLSQPLHRHLLHHRLTQHERVELGETWGPEQMGWIGRAHELVVPLHAPDPTSTTTAALIPRPPHTVQTDDTRLPDDDVVLGRLFVHPERVDEVLTEHLHALTVGLPGMARWWFRRHRDLVRPDTPAHLELCLRLTGEQDYGGAVENLRAWSQQLRRMRLLADLELSTYHPQHGRYGHGEVMDAAETVFNTDSNAALAQLRLSHTTAFDAQALTAASMVDLVSAFSPSPAQGLDWLVNELAYTPGPVDQDIRHHALQVSAPGDDYTTLRQLPGGEEVAQAWRERAQALADYGKRLAAEREPTTVLRSLLHLHQVRALGVSPDQEAVTLRTARAAALAHTTRRPK